MTFWEGLPSGLAAQLPPNPQHFSSVGVTVTPILARIDVFAAYTPSLAQRMIRSTHRRLNVRKKITLPLSARGKPHSTHLGFSHAENGIDPEPLTLSRCREVKAHIGQSRPNSGVEFQVKVHKKT